ncbi:hypothetical protein BpHYR1_021227 [Brachionus plicatilis]|uniref:Uncharacterized protein n=1 Tax=Brachionus plicatilis TaxID=10195 RepID=A0A3M7T336_BRAPC|nr:hypothetical protein BpHYR1_021227 [Brachionus plicatilis]
MSKLFNQPSLSLSLSHSVPSHSSLFSSIEFLPSFSHSYPHFMLSLIFVVVNLFNTLVMRIVAQMFVCVCVCVARWRAPGPGRAYPPPPDT